MGWRKGNAPWLDESPDGSDEGYSSNFKLMTIAAAFLVVTIGLIVVQPGSNDQTDIATADPVIAPSAAPADRADQNQVTRANTASLLSMENPVQKPDVSQLLRNPIRLGGQFHDLRQLSKTALESFGHRSTPNDPLQKLLVQALAEGQSNAYIDTLLNTAAGRGEFAVPVALQTASGRLDTDTLLHGLASLVAQ